ncbi:hypothetical protein MPTK2_4g01160 [Marchantia polymorpha subsp. ruderalis]
MNCLRDVVSLAVMETAKTDEGSAALHLASMVVRVPRSTICSTPRWQNCSSTAAMATPSSKLPRLPWRSGQRCFSPPSDQIDALLALLAGYESAGAAIGVRSSPLPCIGLLTAEPLMW